MISRRGRSGRRILLLAVSLVLSAGIVTAGPAAPAAGPARVSITNDRGTAQGDLTYTTPITVTGNGFQSISGAFGGIYVLFGAVDDPSGGSWRPSRGGKAGSGYRFVPDSETKDNQGFQRFVSFPGSSTEGAANGGVLDASGHFSLTMYIPGPTFTAYDRDNAPVQVDCRVSSCGIITIGAHGVLNPQNETFTPVTFTHLYSEAGTPTSRSTAAQHVPTADTATATPTARPGGSAGSGIATTSPAGTVTTTPAAGSSRAGTGASSGAAPPAVSSGSAGSGGRVAEPVLTVDRATAIAGNVLAFTARGFSPGEQLVAVLDDGVVGVGPLVVGGDGSAAGLLALPSDLIGTTHVLKVTGSAQGRGVQVGFAVLPNSSANQQAPIGSDGSTAQPIAASATPAASSGPSSASFLFLGGAVSVLLIVLFLWWSRHRREPADRPIPEVTV